jgi:DNA-binding NarL/FixJ family response regulator
MDGGYMTNRHLQTAEPTPAPRVQVALFNLPPVYRRGLGVGLTEAGYVVHLPSDVVAWAAESTGPKVAVTTDSEQSLDALDSLRTVSRDVISVVLVEEATLVGYTRALPRCTAAVPLNAELDDVLAAIRAARNGFTMMPIDIAQILAARGEANAEPPDLSERELAWLRALANNVTVLSLARQSGYSEREMYRLLSALYERLGTTTRTSALLRADRLGLLRSSLPTQLTVDLTDRTATRRTANGVRSG